MGRVALILLALLIASQAHGAAWTLEQGKGKAYVTSSFTYGDHSFDDDGTLVQVPEYRKFSLTAAVEYGVRPWLTTLAKVEFDQITDHGSAAVPPLLAPQPATFGAFEGGARVRLLTRGSWVFSAQATGFTGGYDAAGGRNPDEGAGAEVRALAGVGTTLRGRPVFANGELAYRARSGRADAVKLDLSAGINVTPRWLVIAQSFSTFEIGNGVHYHKVSGSLVRELSKRLSVQASGIATVYGRNALREFGGSLSLWYDLGG